MWSRSSSVVASRSRDLLAESCVSAVCLSESWYCFSMMSIETCVASAILSKLSNWSRWYGRFMLLVCP